MMEEDDNSKIKSFYIDKKIKHLGHGKFIFLKKFKKKNFK